MEYTVLIILVLALILIVGAYSLGHYQGAAKAAAEAPSGPASTPGAARKMAP